MYLFLTLAATIITTAATNNTQVSVFTQEKLVFCFIYLCVPSQTHIIRRIYI